MPRPSTSSLNSLKRLAASVFLALIASSLLAQTALAATQTPSSGCCRCSKGDPEKPICLSTDIACADVINQLKSKNPALNGITCTDNLNAAQCATVANGGVCSEQAEAALYEPAGGGTAGQAQTSAAASTLPFKALSPTSNIEIPGLQYSTNIQGDAGYVTLPYIAQYISAIYNYAVGAAIIAAALMVVYGGFKYLLGSTVKSISTGRETILSALAGLILVFASYAILNLVNPEVAIPKPLTIRVARYDDEFLTNLTGNATEYTPTPVEIKQRTADAVSTLSQAGSAGQGPETAQAPAVNLNASLGDVTLPNDPYNVVEGWAVDTDGKKLWPIGCDGFHLSGKGNAPGSYATISKAFVGKPKTLEGLKMAITEARQAGKIGTFYARGIEDLKKPYPFITEPTEQEIQDNKAWSSYIARIPKDINKKKAGVGVHVVWILKKILNDKKWITGKITKQCGENIGAITGGAGAYWNNFVKRFTKDQESRKMLAPCVNSIFEVYNNTYYRVAKCFDVFTNQCSFETYFQTNFGKNPNATETGVPQADLIDKFKAGTYQAGTGILTGNQSHQWLYTGGLGLGFEVLEFGGNGGSAPPIIVQPGLFGDSETKFDRGLGIETSIASYLQSHGATYNVAPVTW